MMKSEIKRNHVKNKNHIYIYIHKTNSNKNTDKINLLYQIIFIQSVLVFLPTANLLLNMIIN